MDFFPPSPLPGSNAIGSFVIGVSPIGTINPFVWQETVISQYANSPRLLTMIENFAQYLDQSANLDAFFDMMWNIDTAQGYGLDVWGRILGGVNRVLEVETATYFGFEEALPGSNPWNSAPFYTGDPVTSNYTLTDAAYRPLLLAKALANVCDGSIPAINQLLMNLFPPAQGKSYVIDNADMTLTYRFEFELTPVQRAIVTQSGILPTPTGVTANIVSN